MLNMMRDFLVLQAGSEDVRVRWTWEPVTGRALNLAIPVFERISLLVHRVDEININERVLFARQYMSTHQLMVCSKVFVWFHYALSLLVIVSASLYLRPQYQSRVRGQDYFFLPRRLSRLVHLNLSSEVEGTFREHCDVVRLEIQVHTEGLEKVYTHVDIYRS